MSIDICPDYGDSVSELTEENEKLTARIAELEEKQRWIPVSERLPEANEMSVSEHANYLLNEYGRLQFDYAAYYKPYGESLRNEARNNLEEYIATLEAEVEALRPYRDGFDPQERLPEVNKYEPDTSVNVDALILTSSGVVFWGTLYYHFGKKEWLGIRDNMVILRWYPELPYSEREVNND